MLCAIIFIQIYYLKMHYNYDQLRTQYNYVSLYLSTCMHAVLVNLMDHLTCYSYMHNYIAMYTHCYINMDSASQTLFHVIPHSNISYNYPPHISPHFYLLLLPLGTKKHHSIHQYYINNSFIISSVTMALTVVQIIINPFRCIISLQVGFHFL